ncbi:MAG: DNA translocase FtsK 4TM domain-containing protein, partial [Vicinamibacterales bacterium]|nr:DNA translocase FtsK 4TM domain-containing protein [Vicinamibacterales bacterium]
MAGPGSTLSRRLSEVVGVAFFATALIWLIALVSYDPHDPVWFFSTGLHEVPVNFVGRIGAFAAELSYQVLGYGAYLLPAMLVVAGWHYFWCAPIDAVYTKLTGSALLVGCTSTFMSLVLGRVDVGQRPFRAGGYTGEFFAGWMGEYLGASGSVIVILTLLFVAVVLATQFSFGRLFGALFAGLGHAVSRARTAAIDWVQERRKARQRRDVIAKHTKRGTASPEALKAAERPAPTPPV